MPEILLTICARGGSKGVKSKNIRPLAGVPLITHTVQQAQAWAKADQIVVSTDSEEIAEVVRKLGVKVPFLRPAELATDTAAKLPVMRHALRETERRTGKTYPLIVDLDPTAPVRKTSDLDRCLELFEAHHPDSIISVAQSKKNPYFNMVETDAKGRARISKQPAQGVVRRQDAPAVYDINGSIYLYRRDFLMKEDQFSPLGENSLIYVMDEWAGVDIDREIDFQFIEFLIRDGRVRL